MKNINDLKSRNNKVLGIVIQNYIDTAKPISSRTVCRKARLGLSSATVRNIMADLEDMGYITHPHTSAGRIPAYKGYRFYVDSLMEKESLGHKDVDNISRIYEKGWRNLDDLMQLTAKTLSRLMYTTSFVAYPTIRKTLLKQIELVPFGDKKIVVNLLLSSGILKSAVIEITTKCSYEEARKISNFLNSECSGMNMEAIEGFLRRSLITYTDSLFLLCKEAQEILNQSHGFDSSKKIYLEGASYILEQPEFRNSSKARGIMQILEEKDKLYDILYGDSDSEYIRIRIGEENIFEEMKDCSVVTSPYKMGEDVFGMVGFIGPTRLEYPRAVAALEYMSRLLEEYFEK